MNLSHLDTFVYPPEVKWSLDQNNVDEFLKLAKSVNSNPLIQGVILQHEYGIYGGVDGENILEFMKVCSKPLIVTLHTVLPHTSEHMYQVTSQIVKYSRNLIVLTNKTKLLLESKYPNAIGKTTVIPHGIHPTPFTTTTKMKKKLNLSNHEVITTFGLLSRGKGIEYVIKALPKVIKKHPHLLYLILGETHPVVRRQEGEIYRNQLAKLVTKLELKQHVRFYDQFLSLEDLLMFFKATDIYLCTSINPNQSVSGTLSYALGSGRAVISTEFEQAKELINTGNGLLVPIKQVASYSKAILKLLEDKHLLKQQHLKAYQDTRHMLWSNVCQNYLKILDLNFRPQINLTHLNNMTDNFGLFQFANHEIPDPSFGYTLDDNARALVVCLWMNFTDRTTRLASIYLKYIEFCQNKDGTFTNYIDVKNRKSTPQNLIEDLDESSSRAFWALGEALASDKLNDKLKIKARSVFLKYLPYSYTPTHLRTAAFHIKACEKAFKFLPDHQTELKQVIQINSDFLLRAYQNQAHKKWRWFSPKLEYNNAILPEALIIAGHFLQNPLLIKTSLITLNFLINKTFSQYQYRPIGHSHWYLNHGKRSLYDQQAEDPSAMILLLNTAYSISKERKYLYLREICFSWFLGNNPLRQPLYNSQTGGCFDGLHQDRINQNQGAESQVSYLLSRLSMNKFP